MISSKPLNIFFPNTNLVLSWIIMSQSLMQKISLLFSKSTSQQGLIWSEYASFYYVFWTADPFATKLGLIVHYHKPECFMKKLDCCVQGRHHSKISKCQWMQYPLNCWSFFNQIWYGDASSWARLSSKKDFFAVFEVKVTVKDHKIKIWLFNICNETWFYSRSSKAGLSCKKKKKKNGLLCFG